MENVISKDAPDEMLVMYRGAVTELLVPIAERAIEIYLGTREMVLSPGQACRFTLDLRVIADADKALSEDLAEAISRAEKEETWIYRMRAALAFFRGFPFVQGNAVHDKIKEKILEIYRQASRNTIATDFRVQALQAETT